MANILLNASDQRILKGKFHCTVDLLFDCFGISCMITDNFCFYLQNRLIQTGGRWYSDPFPFSIPCSDWWISCLCSGEKFRITLKVDLRARPTSLWFWIVSLKKWFRAKIPVSKHYSVVTGHSFKAHLYERLCSFRVLKWGNIANALQSRPRQWTFKWGHLL